MFETATSQLPRRAPAQGEARRTAPGLPGRLGGGTVSAGHRVVLAADAPVLAAEHAGRGFEVPVEVSEFAAAGGGPKCCTLESRP
jgi:hypothetical protein